MSGLKNESQNKSAGRRSNRLKSRLLRQQEQKPAELVRESPSSQLKTEDISSASAPALKAAAKKKERIERLRSRLFGMRTSKTRERKQKQSAVFKDSVAVQASDWDAEGVGAATQIKFPLNPSGCGHFYIREESFGEDYVHGSVGCYRDDASIQAFQQHLLSVVDGNVTTDWDLDKIIFLDTETTGLSHGAGTFAFLVGLMYWQNGAWKIEQLFISDPSRESAALRYLKKCMKNKPLLVSYNGRSYDWPLLQNRFVLHRQRAPRPKYHLDLLHWARRIYKGRLQQSRLIDIESEVLGYDRVDDLPGALVPKRYFAFLKREHFALVDPIIEHNRDDVLSMLGLLNILGRQSLMPEAQENTRSTDLIAFGHHALLGSDDERSKAYFERAVTLAGDDYELACAYLGLADWAKKQNLFDASLDYLKCALAFESSLSRYEVSACHVRCAKIYEHKQRDFSAALEHASFALEAEGEDGQKRRIERLLRRRDAAEQKAKGK